MIKIFLLILLALALHSEEILHIGSELKQLNTTKFQTIYEDSNKSLSLEDIVKKTSNKSTNLFSTKESKSAFWIDVPFVNSTDKIKNVIIKHPRAGIDKVDVYLFKDDLLISTFKMGDLREQSQRELLYRNSMFIQQLEPNAKYRMISRLESYGAYELYWLVEDPNYFAYTGSIQTLVWGLFGGILLTLFIYNMSMFVHLKDRAFLVYSIHVLITFWYQYAINGIIYQYFHAINLNFITISVWVAPYLAQTFVFLFAYYFFKLNGSKIGKWILFSGWISFFISMFYLSALFDMDRLFLAKYITLPSLSFALFLILFSIYMIYKRYTGSLYFFLGQGVFLLCNIYSVSIASANMQPSEFSWVVMPMGIIFDLIFLSLALGQRIHKIKEESKNNERIIFEQARFSSIGQTVGSITHQWKLPISQLSSQIMFLTATFNHNKKNFLYEFEKTAPKIADTIDYMQENIDMFHDFYKSANQKISFNPKKEIDTILKILDDKIVLGNITVTLWIDETEIFCYKSAFSNIAMILIENSVEAFTDKVGDKKIEISIVSQAGKTIFSVSDNAGGVDSKILKNIFISNQTTKPEQGCGFGLPIAKNLAEKQLGGKIGIENSKDGAIFKVVF